MAATDELLRTVEVSTPEGEITVPVYGEVDPAAIEQLARCMQYGSARGGALMADAHLGYSQPIGGVVAYEHHVSPSGAGYDLGCGLMGVKTDVKAADLDGAYDSIADEIARRISFGMGRPNNEPVDDPIFDRIANADFAPQRQLLDLARNQLGTVGAGNHFVSVTEDEADGTLWITCHFGSRGFGHKTASGFLAIAQGGEFTDHAPDGEMHSPPVLLDARTDAGQAYIASAQLAYDYAYAGRRAVCNKVMEIIGCEAVETINEHHNASWLEEHDGQKLWVVRKGATPAAAGQLGVVGGSMEKGLVVIEGSDNPEAAASLNSAMHGAGRVMSRTKAAGKFKGKKLWQCSNRDCDYKVDAPKGVQAPKKKFCPDHPEARAMKHYVRTKVRDGAVDFDAVKKRLKDSGIELRGAAADEAPEVYKDLDQVIAAHAGYINVRHRLRPRAVVMAGPDTVDPFKD